MDDRVRASVGRALGRIPSGIFVCSCGTAESSVPFIASWVQQVAMVPPAVSVAIEAGRTGLRAVTAGRGAFTLSVLPEGRDDLMKPFFGAARDAGPFGGLAVERAPGGGIYLADALAWMECRELVRAPAGSHVLLVGEVAAGDVLRDGRPRVHIRKSGFSY